MTSRSRTLTIARCVAALRIREEVLDLNGSLSPVPESSNSSNSGSLDSPPQVPDLVAEVAGSTPFTSRSTAFTETESYCAPDLPIIADSPASSQVPNPILDPSGSTRSTSSSTAFAESESYCVPHLPDAPDLPLPHYTRLEEQESVPLVLATLHDAFPSIPNGFCTMDPSVPGSKNGCSSISRSTQESTENLPDDSRSAWKRMRTRQDRLRRVHQTIFPLPTFRGLRTRP